MHYYMLSRRWFSRFELFLAGFFTHSVIIEAFYNKNYPMAAITAFAVIVILATYRKEYKNVK